MSKRFTIGQSKVNCWNRCKQEYHYKYVEELQRKRTKRPFMFGKIVHRMIEEHAQKRDPMKVLNEIAFENEDLFTAEREMYGEIVEDTRVIMGEYFEYWGDDSAEKYMLFIPVVDENGEKRYSEHEFAIDIDDDLVFKGQIDSIVRTPNKHNLRWLGENKSFDNLPNDDHRWRNLQSVAYMRALDMLGWLKQPVHGVCWNYIRSKPPTVPQVLKDGSRLSEKDVVTLPSVVHRVLKAHNLDAKDHTKILNRALEARREYFQRIFTPVNRTIADNIYAGFLDSGREMSQYHGKKKHKNIGRHCDWCDYEPICRAELTGADVDFVKEREYTHEDPEAYRRQARDAKQGVAREKARGTRSSKLRVLR